MAGGGNLVGVYDDVTYVYDDVTYVYDDVTYVLHLSIIFASYLVALTASQLVYT